MPMRILMVAARYLPLMGGIETHVFETARRMAAAGIDVEVLTTDTSGELPASETRDGFRISRVPAYPKTSDMRFAPSLGRHIAQSRADVVHMQGYHTFVAPHAMYAAIRNRIPLVLSFHSGGHSSGLRNAVRGAQRAALAPLATRASHLIGVSRFEADFFSRTMGIPRDRFTVVPNGAGLPPAGPGAARPSKSEPLIIAIGRLEKYKGHQRAIEALPHLLKSRPAAHLRILGGGPYEAELKALATARGLSGKVTIGGIPASDRQAMSDLLAGAALVVLLSDYEAHPVAVMEALSLGRPVLATQSSGFLEMIEAGLVSGIPLDASPDTTAAAMLQAIDRPSPATAPVLPTWEGCTEQLLAIYRRVLGEAGQTSRLSSGSALAGLPR